MTIIEKLDQAFVDRHLQCREGVARAEFVDPQRTGLYILVSASSPGQGTYFLRYKDATGKTCHQKIGRTADISLAEARKRVRDLKAVIQLGADPRGEHKAKKAVPTFSEFFETVYLPEIKPRLRSWKKSEGIYRMYLKDEFGHLRLNEIRKQSVHALGARLVERGLSPSMSDHVLKVIRAALNISVSFGVIDVNPISRVRLLRVDNRVERYMSPDELDRLLAVLRTDGNRPVCLVALMALASGMRLNEVTSARWADVNREARTLRIAASTSKSKRIRSVPLNDIAMDVLDQLGTEGKSEYLFVSGKTGAHLSHIHKVWDRLRKKAELPNLRLHDLRHQYASFLVNSGRSLYEVQKILGHSSHSVTERYAHLSSKSLMDAANTASDRIKGATTEKKAATTEVATAAVEEEVRAAA